MILQILFLANSLFNFSDTLMFPIKEGNIKDLSKRKNIYHEPLEAVIYPTKYLEVSSCSNGKIVNIKSTFDSRFSVMVKIDNFFFAYKLDTVIVKNGEYIKMGQVIGKLRDPATYNELQRDFPLIFTVSKMDKLINANKYLIFKEKFFSN